jgi:hypothetical protein
MKSKSIWLISIFQNVLYLNILKSTISATCPPLWDPDSRVITDSFVFVPTTFSPTN